MVFALAFIALLDVPAWIQHDAVLAKREIVKIESLGGDPAGASFRTIRDDGLVNSWSTQDRNAPTPPFRLSKTDLKKLRDLIAHTDFDRMESGPRAKIDPQTVDGVDQLFVVRKGRSVRWWSNAVYEPTDESSALFRFIAGLHPSSFSMDVSKVSTWGY